MKTLDQIQEENRKAIIMACNPEAKSYEEALKMELGLGCKVVDLLGTISSKQSECFLHEVSYSTFTGFVLRSLDGYDSFNKCCDENIENVDYFKIIGKPLTLDRVLIALGLVDEYITINIFGSVTTWDQHGSPTDDIKLFDWSLTKQTLEEQTEDTQRAINELIGNIYENPELIKEDL